MITSFLNNLNKQDKFIFLFLLKGLALYLLWFFLYENWLLKDGLVDQLLIEHLTVATATILEWMGYTTFQYSDAVGVDGTHGVLIGAPCNGMNLFALFAGFIIIFRGKLKYKLIYLPLGLVTIHLINILRLAGLALVVVYYPESLEFNHKYTFTALVYAYIFVLWIIWVNKFARKE